MVDVYIEQLSQHVGESVTLKGWLYNSRSSGKLMFLILRDGTGLCQCVASLADVGEEAFETAKSLTQESSFTVTGTVRKEDRAPGGYEMDVKEIELVSLAHEYPITPKEHGVEFLADRRHLWVRSKRQWAILRIRHSIIKAIRNFFDNNGFTLFDSPILTPNAVEGTSTLFETEYFDLGKAYLTQSGQLYGEAGAMAFGKIYVFGPTFRAEKSKTRRHLTEFWMVEPEMAWFDLNDDMKLAEDMMEYIVQTVLEERKIELEYLERDTTVLQNVKAPFPRVSYDEAVDLLHSDKTKQLFEEREKSISEEKDALLAELEENKAKYNQSKEHVKRRMDAREIEINSRVAEIEEELGNLPQWRESALNFERGNDFGGSDETALTWHFEKPIIVHRYPTAVKAFYMKRDPENEERALAMDMLAPEGYGEVIGGSQREDNIDYLLERIKEHGLPQEVFEWFLDLRRYGSVPHSGFGLGIERTVAWICGLKHIRETIPFPRMIYRNTP
ncbi:MAG: asparagine--tRNA ligase [Ectothiorhodospiraceae bacterium]|nr:asparagine--tRNA ligase [Ectothiorhodospiraceae bacterium]